MRRKRTPLFGVLSLLITFISKLISGLLQISQNNYHFILDLVTKIRQIYIRSRPHFW